MPDDPPAMLAIEGGTPLRAAPWPAALPVPPADDPAPVEAVEEAIATYLGLPGAAVVAYADPSEAYRAALGVATPSDDRDELIVPALLGEPAAGAGRDAGWHVVPAELEADTGAMSARGLARALGERTGAVVVAHAFGHPASMTELHRVVRDHGVPVVEDLSGALGASYRGALAGRMGHAGVLTCADGDPISGGAFAIFPDLGAASTARDQRGAPLAEDDARVALAEVRRLDEELTERRRLAWELTFGLRGMKGVTGMPHGRWVHHAYARYVIRLRSILWKRSLDETVEAIRAEGVPCEPAVGRSLHESAHIRTALPNDPRLGEDEFPVASRLPRELIAIPLHSELTSKDMDLVAAVLRKVEARSI